MQTAMQELIERLEILSEKYEDAGLLTAIKIGNSLLEMEKEQILAAFTEGASDGFYGESDSNREQYYQETFGNNGSDDHISDISKMVEVPQQETLYTEEQVREAFDAGYGIRGAYGDRNDNMTSEQYIQSLKQNPKQ
jgi:hypothetical protein